MTVERYRYVNTNSVDLIFEKINENRGLTNKGDMPSYTAI
jgi:hypothetical protein